MRSKDKVALVTGAASGLGKAVATAFAGEGTDLVVLARKESRYMTGQHLTLDGGCLMDGSLSSAE